MTDREARELAIQCKATGQGLVGMMQKCPELFAHIKQEKKLKNPEDWVPVAEKLAKENGGTLQCGHWLNNNGYSALYLAMRRHPELFAHIKQESKAGRNPEEWIPIAEKLAKENGGTLQCGHWLRNNGYSALNRAMQKHPELFAHIRQEKRVRKNPEDWVPVAEKLAKKNGGTLQCIYWLDNNGYRGLYRAMRKRPELFAHIKQENKAGKKPEEWIPIAEKLAKENGGTVPCGQWLDKNGYSGLGYMLRTYPELFPNIKQDKKDRRGRIVA
jgi:hypothetical protein